MALTISSCSDDEDYTFEFGKSEYILSVGEGIPFEVFSQNKSSSGYNQAPRYKFIQEGEEIIDIVYNLDNKTFEMIGLKKGEINLYCVLSGMGYLESSPTRVIVK